jgi:hypothetical protein
VGIRGKCGGYENGERVGWRVREGVWGEGRGESSGRGIYRRGGKEWVI